MLTARSLSAVLELLKSRARSSRASAKQKWLFQYTSREARFKIQSQKLPVRHLWSALCEPLMKR